MTQQPQRSFTCWSKNWLKDIGACLANRQRSAVRQVNRTLVESYWKMGRYIVEFEQQG